MATLDFILNLAALLLWLSWRALRFDPLVRTSVSSLAGTLRRAEPKTARAWQLLIALAALVFGRALLYTQLGPAADWTPRLDLGAVVLAFRSDKLPATLLYSAFSFVRLLVILYFWLLVLTVINGKTADANPIDKMLRLHLGSLSRWPWPVQLLLPVVFTTIAWASLHPLLVWMGVVNRVGLAHLAEQGLVIGAALILTLKYLLPIMLLLYLVISYVYLGRNPLWEYVNVTARNLLKPFQIMPLRVGKVDLSPVLGAIIILLLLQAAPSLLLARYPLLREAIWPQ